MTKALFRDRDGVINEDRGYVFRIQDFAFIDGIFELCRTARDKGYLVIIVTNQSGIARGYFTEADYARLTRFMEDRFAQEGVTIAATYHCPLLQGEDRKPNPGMFVKAQKRFDIDMSASFAVGDKDRDTEAAYAAGIGHAILFAPAPANVASGVCKVSALREIGAWL